VWGPYKGEVQHVAEAPSRIQRVRPRNEAVPDYFGQQCKCTHFISSTISKDFQESLSHSYTSFKSGSKILDVLPHDAEEVALIQYVSTRINNQTLDSH